MVNTVALIGSFRQHYGVIQEIWQQLYNNGVRVTSPKGSSIIEHGIPFVRFNSDPSSWSDHLVQTVALHRILQADMVYVVAPAGYIGRTTCYEIGRLIQANKPIYFSERPHDLPIQVPTSNLLSTSEIIEAIKKQDFNPQPLYSTGDSMHAIYEKELLCEQYRKDDEFES